MKRWLGILLAGFFLLTVQTLPVRAEELYDDTLAALLELGGDANFLPESADLSAPETLTEPGIGGFFAKTCELIRQEARAPLQTFTLLLGVILLSALAGGLRIGEGTGVVYETLCTLCAVCIVCEPLISVFERAAAMLQRTSSFMLGFTGIYGGIMAVTGHFSTAAVYQGSMAVLCEIAEKTALSILLPLLSMSLAMSIADAVDPVISLRGLIGMTQKISAWLLGFLMAGFLGLLSVQSLVTAAADRAGTKAAKYVISGAVPIVGGAVSDAYAAVLGSFGVLHSTVGMTGILLTISLLLPTVVELWLYRMLTMCAGAVSELFDVPVLTRLFKNLETVLATGFSAAVSFSVMFLFSTAVMLLIGNGTPAG